MKRTLLCLTFGMAVCWAFHPGDDDHPWKHEDARPFGKYLIRVCELGRGCYDPTQECKKFSCDCIGPHCKDAPPPTKAQTGKKPPLPEGCTACNSKKKPQKITLALARCPDCNTDQDYPPKVGDTFYVKASTDAATLSLALAPEGPVYEGDQDGTVHSFTVTGPGAITLTATQDGDDTYLPAVASTLVLTTADDGPSASCYGLYSKPSSTSTQPDINAIAALAGNPVPFVLATQGDSTILIYSTRWPILQHEEKLLAQITKTLNGPLGTDAKDSFGIKPPTPKQNPIIEELSIAHAAALGDPAARINALGYSPISVQNIGSTAGRVRITVPATTACKDWKNFLAAVKYLEWSVVSVPSVTKLWYLSSDDAANAMTTLFPPPPASSPGSGSGTPAGSTPPPASPPTSAAITVAQPPGSKIEIKTDTTPCVRDGLVYGNSNACASAASGSVAASSGSSTSGSSAAPVAISPPKTIPTASIGIPLSTPAAGSLPASPKDMLIYGNPTPGDDAQLAERNRIIAQLDLPRPEMMINAWVIQNSTSDPRAMGKFSSQVRTMVERYNESLERMVLAAYGIVTRQMSGADYFDEAFYHYVSDRYIAQGQSTDPSPQDYLDGNSATMAAPPNDRGYCEADHYCLGYSHLLNTSNPRLTDLLLALVAAKEPLKRVLETVTAIQGLECCCTAGEKNSGHCQTRMAIEEDLKRSASDVLSPACDRCVSIPAIGQIVADFSCSKGEPGNRCTEVSKRLGLPKPPNPINYLDPSIDCTTADEWGILWSQFHGQSGTPRHPTFFLACFARAAQVYLSDAGAARAAVADFLYQYKHSQQYPHEFSSYYLSQSAANLNSVLSPIIDAFNRDVVAFQTYLRTDLEYEIEVANHNNDERCCASRVFGINKPSFFNDGIVSVATISGQGASVQSTSQSFLNASKAPSLADLLSAAGGASSPASTSALGSLLGSTAAPVSLLSSVLSSYQTTFAQIGRNLQLQAVPRSLATASAAEISVNLQTGDSANPAYFGGPPSATQQNTSEVSNYQVTTRIRVDSVKLFELSSYGAVLERSKSKFPLLPPFVEIPYIGTFAGIPLPAAKEYHASTAIISAIVVPTAADIGFGLKFYDDLVPFGDGVCSVNGKPGTSKCDFRRAQSIRDLHAPVDEYHDAMILCLRTETSPARKPMTPTAMTGRVNFVNPQLNQASFDQKVKKLSDNADQLGQHLGAFQAEVARLKQKDKIAKTDLAPLASAAALLDSDITQLRISADALQKKSSKLVEDANALKQDAESQDLEKLAADAAQLGKDAEQLKQDAAAKPDSESGLQCKDLIFKIFPFEPQTPKAAAPAQ